MKTIKKVIRVDFDNDENRLELAETKIEIFKAEDDEKSTASLKITQFLHQFDNIHIYKGWNDQIYPKFLIVV